jgi:TRAP transporter TAXI family solute receptor
MRRKLIRVAVVAALLLLPFIVRVLYVQLTALPDEVIVATGPADGRYRQIGEGLKAELRRRHPRMTVTLKETDCSLENLQLLQRGEVDFALYQTDTESILQEAPTAEHDEIAFVSNLYSEVAHFIVRNDSDINTPDDLRGHTVAIGQEKSGDYAMSQILLEHFGLDEQAVEVRRFDYVEIEKGLQDGSLDAAFITSGIRADVFKSLLADGLCRLLDVPHTDVLSVRHLAVSPYVIPAGLYRPYAPAVPPQDIHTVTLRAQLLTRSDTSNGLVKEVTGIVLSERFVKQQELTELFADGNKFASDKPEFTPHPATAGVFDPHMRPLLNTDFVEATEGIRSFVVSFLIAGYLAFRWFRRYRIRGKEHRLDQYIRTMLELERKQLDLDQYDGSSDLEALQTLLDELTGLRQEALAELTAHELNEDRAAASFLEMAHALSDKINAKISRQRLDKRFQELTEVLRNERQSGSN